MAAAAVAKSIETLDETAIESMYDNEVRAALDVLQQGRANGETRFIFVIPPMHEMGASGYAASCAAAEGVRVLALSAARQWMAEGVTVNCIAALADDDIAPLVDFLSRDAGAGVSGETIRVGGPPMGL